MHTTQVIAQACKKTTDCDKKEVCDKGACRRDRRGSTRQSNAALAKVCLSKGIPITYERNTPLHQRGQRKTHDALVRCKQQKPRTTAAKPGVPAMLRSAAKEKLASASAKVASAIKASAAVAAKASTTKSSYKTVSKSKSPVAKIYTRAELEAMEYFSQLVPLHNMLVPTGKHKMRKDLVVDRILRKQQKQ